MHIYLHGLTYDDAFAIPQEAVMRDDQGFFVYTIKDGKSVKQPVEVGQMIDGLWIIKSGLTNGMTVVTAGGVKIAAGDEVVVDSTENQTKTNPNNPAQASAPAAVTPNKANASEYVPNQTQRAVQIESSADIYNGKY